MNPLHLDLETIQIESPQPLTDREVATLYSMEADVGNTLYTLESLDRAWRQAEYIATELSDKVTEELKTHLMTLQGYTYIPTPGTLESFTFQHEGITTQGMVWDFVVKLWKAITDFCKAIWSRLKSMARKMFGNVALRKRELVDLKHRIKSKQFDSIKNRRTEISKNIRKLSVNNVLPKSGTDIANTLSSTRTVLEAMRTAGMSDKGEMIYDLFTNFNIDDTGDFKKELIEFITLAKDVDTGMTLGNFRSATPDINARYSTLATVTQWDILGDQSIVKVTPNPLAFNLSTDLPREDILACSRRARIGKVVVENTFNIEPLDPNEIFIDTMSIPDLQRMEEHCSMLLKSLDELEVGKQVLRQEALAERIQKRGDRISEQIASRKGGDDVDQGKVNIWQEIANWSQWYATASALYKPKVMFSVMEGVKAAIAIGHQCLDNYA